MQFELGAPAGSSEGGLVIGWQARRLNAGSRRLGSSGSLCASISANAASQVLGPTPALAALAQDAQQGLLVAAAVVRTFVVRGSTTPLRRHRRKPSPKLGSSSGKAAASTAAHAAAPAAAAAAGSSLVAAKATVAATATVATPAQKARSLQQFLAGGIAGAVAKTLVAPLERVSTLLMADAQRFSVGQAARHAWRDGLYRGHAATLIKIFPASAIQFAVFNGLKDRILAGKQHLAAATGAAVAAGGKQQAQQQQPAAAAAAAAPAAAAAELANHERLLAGAAAGAAAACACYPLESLRTMMSVAGGVRGNLLQVGRHVVAAHGLGALYRGFRASLIGDVLGNSLGFTAYEILNRIYRDHFNGGAAPPPHLRGMIGACSAACVVTLTMPLEVVRRRLQVQGLAGRPILYRGTLDCIQQVLRKEGLRGFYAASLPSYLKVAPSIGCMYFLYELFMTSIPAQPATTAPAPAPAALPAAPPAK